jgi:hypothetical protein
MRRPGSLKLLGTKGKRLLATFRISWPVVLRVLNFTGRGLTNPPSFLSKTFTLLFFSPSPSKPREREEWELLSIQTRN